MAGLGFASYTALGGRRHPTGAHCRPALAVTLVAVAISLGGCSTIMRPLSGWSSSQSGPPPGEITGSIPRSSVAAPAPDSDGDVIRRTVESHVRATTTPPRIEWKNPSSGNSGTITGLVAAKASNGAPCRDFDTTLATVDGVRLYKGRACQGYEGPWDLVDFGPVEADPAG